MSFLQNQHHVSSRIVKSAKNNTHMHVIMAMKFDITAAMIILTV